MTRTLCVAALVLGLVSCTSDVTKTQLKTAVPTNSSHAHAHTNRLAREKSPYLLQHQHNPVDWFAWGEEAFTKARLRENKPIFLSIGYSTCHWCHVMERESFEKDDVAEFLNAHFVSIKVDREERPDVDKIYMTFVQSMTGFRWLAAQCLSCAGLEAVLRRDVLAAGSEVWAPSFLQVLRSQIHSAWTNRREQIASSSTNLHEKLIELTGRSSGSGVQLEPGLLRRAGKELKEGYDWKHGGWGGAPKFPSPSHPLFVLRHGVRVKDAEAVKMVLHMCERMAAGGICPINSVAASRVTRWMRNGWSALREDAL